MKTVLIVGGGISGLTVAHQLSALKKYKIIVIEKDDEIGGLAKSKRDKRTGACATEISWRVVFGFYDNLFKILREVGAYDHLTTYKHENFVDSPFLWHDKWIAFLNTLYGYTCCDQRLNDLDNTSWYETLKQTSPSNVFRMVAPWLGMDRYKASYKSVIDVAMEQQILPAFTNPTYHDYVFTKPTSEAWFEPWQEYLQKQGVEFVLGTEVLSIQKQLEQRTSAAKTVMETNEVSFQKSQGFVSIRTQDVEFVGDYLVLALPTPALTKLTHETKCLNYLYPSIKKLNETCLHTQLSFQIYFDKPINLGGKNAFLVVDSPWDLIVLSYDQIFEKSSSICEAAPSVRGAWSVTVCTSYIKGLNGKSFDYCSYDEIKAEIWAQLTKSATLKECISHNNPFELTKSRIIGWSPLWDTFYHRKDGKLATSEPKFTNNTSSYALRPSFKTHEPNVFIATAFVKETIDIFSMEAAAIAGKYVANSIDEQCELPIIRPRPFLFLVWRLLDIVWYTLGIANINLYVMSAVGLCVVVIVGSRMAKS